MTILDALRWRYATKTFDASKKISMEAFEELLEALRLSASSYGLQPWKFVVVENPELRAKVREIAWNQGQVTDASHLIVLCRPETVTAADVDHFVQVTASTRGIDAASLDGYKQMMLGTVNGMDEEKKAVWMAKQVYLALGNLLTVCAVQGIDACPMEGFDPAKCDEILGLPALGLRSVVLCPVGYRADDDKYASLAKVRYPKEEVIVRK